MKVQIMPAQRWYMRAKFKILEDWTSPAGTYLPAGFVSDGVSVPFMFRWLVSPTGPVFYAAVIHDYYIQFKGWNTANLMFERELNKIAIGTLRKRVLILIVKGWAYVRSCRSKY